MKRPLILRLFVILFLTGCQTRVPAPDPDVIPVTLPVVPTPIGQSGEWDLLFSDEFNGTALDPSKWTTCYWWNNGGCTIGSNNELEWYQPGNVFVADGHLHLQAQRKTIDANNGETYFFTSGIISSGRSTSDQMGHAGLVFQYGYVEIKAKLPGGRGLWPAFWMLPDNNESKPEVDIIEVLGHAPDTVHMALHYHELNGNDARAKNVWAGPDFSAGWHTFAIAWQADALIWYVDGLERWRYTDQLYIPNQPMYLLLNLAVGGDWPGAPEGSTIFPSDYEIDYVRVWR